MKWAEIVIVTSRESVEAVTGILYTAGVGGVVIEDPAELERDWRVRDDVVYELSPADYPDQGVRIKAYLPYEEDFSSQIRQLQQSIQKLRHYGLDLGPNILKWVEVREEDWANSWKKYFKPISITPRLTIKPVWEEYQPQKDSAEIVIELDPGMAFGTGTHETTRMCLQALETYLTQGDRVIDVGCGSGILSIAAAKLGASQVLALDIDDVALRASQENTRLNRLEDRVVIKKNELLEGIQQPAELIVANLLTELILRLIPQTTQCLVDGGILIASGILKEKAEQVTQQLMSQGLQPLSQLTEGDWACLIAQRPAAS